MTTSRVASADTPRLAARKSGFNALPAEMIGLAKLVPAVWNANRVAPETLVKIRRSIEEFGFVENLVARKHPTARGKLEVLSGNHRLGLLAELGFTEAPVVVVDVGDADARILAQALNRTRGEDDPEAYARLLEDVLADVGYERVVEFLPETESSIDRSSAPSHRHPRSIRIWCRRCPRSRGRSRARCTNSAPTV